MSIDESKRFDAMNEERWNDKPLANLIAHILTAYHQPLREDLLRLESLARKVLEVHRPTHPDLHGELLATLVGLSVELELHMAKEEQILFPMLRNGMGAAAGPPISVMEAEHDEATAALTRLSDLTNGYRVPDGACKTWQDLWHGLAALDRELRQHIRLESDILFPRALKD